MDKKRKSAYFPLLLVLSVVFLGSCHQRSEEDEMAVKMLRTATETMEKENNRICVQFTVLSEIDPSRNSKNRDLAQSTMSLLANFKKKTLTGKFSLSNIKMKYQETMDSLSKMMCPVASTNIFLSMMDSTFAYFEDDKELFLLKTQFDINKAIYLINSKRLYGGEKPTKFQYWETENKSMMPLNPNYKAGEDFSILFLKPYIGVEKMKVKIDSIVFNNKRKISYQLFQPVHILDFDSTLKKGSYTLKGNTVYDKDGFFGVKAMNYNFNIH
jgi:hypothetical protein